MLATRTALRRLSKSKKPNITAADIVDLLAHKHGDEVFIRECKDGPSQHCNHSRLDAWAMKRSWSSPCYFGYEVKVSRSDFVNDTKWPTYLPLCNTLTFVCPTGLIAVDEVPEQCGLIYVSKTGSRLFTKKKAPYREVEPPLPLLLYALMRAQDYSGTGAEVKSRAETAEYRRRKWRAWLRQKIEDRELGYDVSRGIRKTVDAKIRKVERESERVGAVNEGLQEVQQILDELGIKPTDWDKRKRVPAALTGDVPDQLRRELERGKDAMETLLKHWDAHVEAQKKRIGA